ncbi:MAG: hypothetical protein J4F31_04320 [Flavobacteriales bacterium]|nr:hypothetical protein [Flavobacteriales bacterium]
MDAKLTLKLDKRVIESAKVIAASKKISLSKMIEAYLSTLVNSTEEKDSDISPYVKSISGLIDLPEDYDYKKEYRDYLEEKYK